MTIYFPSSIIYSKQAKHKILFYHFLFLQQILPAFLSAKRINISRNVTLCFMNLPITMKSWTLQYSVEQKANCLVTRAIAFPTSLKKQKKRKKKECMFSCSAKRVKIDKSCANGFYKVDSRGCWQSRSKGNESRKDVVTVCNWLGSITNNTNRRTGPLLNVTTSGTSVEETRPRINYYQEIPATALSAIGKLSAAWLNIWTTNMHRDNGKQRTATAAAAAAIAVGGWRERIHGAGRWFARTTGTVGRRTRETVVAVRGSRVVISVKTNGRNVIIGPVPQQVTNEAVR